MTSDKGNLTGDFRADVERMDAVLRAGASFDLVRREFNSREARTVMYYLSGMTRSDSLEKLLLSFEDGAPFSDAATFAKTSMPSSEARAESSVEAIAGAVLSGMLAILSDAFGAAAVIADYRIYPARNSEEPENDKVMRGSRDRFVETLLTNVSLIRRRIRDPLLTMELFRIGTRSRTDVVVCYMAQSVDRRLLHILEDKLKNIRVPALSMGQESLRECLLPRQLWNPFPRFRYTERPDTAAACLYDGNIIVLVDGTPSAMIVPTGLFDFIQDINDYYFTPLVGTFFKFVRGFMFLLSLLFIPTWYVLSLHHTLIPEQYWFIFVNHPNGVSVYLQLMVSEFLIDMLRLASLNTPNVLSNSFSVIGALVLGEFGVSSGLFVHEVVMFMAFTSISNFVLPSYELGFSIKFCRMLLLTLTFLFDFWGYFAALLLIAVLICTTKTLDGYTYLYPLFPFNKDALVSALFRKRLHVQK